MTFSFNIGGITPQDAQNQDAGGGGSTTIIDSISPQKAGGICFWLDGQCNTRAGKDHTKTYLENISWVNSNSNINGNLEYFTNTAANTWDGDFLKLGTYAYYPFIYSSNVSMESVIKINEIESPSLMVYSTAYGCGFYVLIDDVRKVRFGYRQGSNYSIITSDTVLEYSTPYYIACVFDSNTNASLTILNESVSETKTAEIISPFVYVANINAGVGTQAMNNTNINGERWNGLSLGMVRGWNRVLTDTEILQNYQDVKKRFNF